MLFHFSTLLLIFIFFKIEIFARDVDEGIDYKSPATDSKQLPRLHVMHHKNASFIRRKNTLPEKEWNKASPYIEQQIIGSVHFKENLTSILFKDAIEISLESINQKNFFDYYKACHVFLNSRYREPYCFILHALSGELSEKLGIALNMNIIYSYGNNLTLYYVVDSYYTKNIM